MLLFLYVAFNSDFLQTNTKYLGGGINYSIVPEIFAWANFDGEHFLAIAYWGYKPLEQAFFPLYPLIISSIPLEIYSSSNIQYLNLTFNGLIVSNLMFLLSLIALFKLLKIDYSGKIAFGTLLLLVFFPTSFYFGALYSESLFLLLTVSSFYFARKKRWWLAALLGGLASLTRVFGVLLFPALVIEMWQQKESLRKIIRLLFIPFGLLIYMYYQWINFGDPLAFYNLQLVVGEQHQRGIVLLPQVFYRYINMLITVSPNNLIYQTIVLELLIGILFFFLPIYGFYKKIRLSYLFFAMMGFLLTTFQGSFSSSPRYILVLFPSFLAFYLFISKWPRIFIFFLILAMTILLGIETVIFLKGHWVA